MPEDEHRGVVAVAGEVGHGDHPGGQLAGVGGAAGGGELRDAGQPLVDRMAGPLHHPVGDQHEGTGTGQDTAARRVPLAVEDAQRQPALVQHDLAAAVVGGPHRRDVPGAGVDQFAGLRVEAEEGAGHEEPGSHGDQQVVGAGEHLRRFRGGDGDGPQAGAHLAHVGGGLDVVALHVTDRAADGAVRHGEHVVPVAADVEPVAGGGVPARHAQPPDGGEGAPRVCRCRAAASSTRACCILIRSRMRPVSCPSVFNSSSALLEGAV